MQQLRVQHMSLRCCQATWSQALRHCSPKLSPYTASDKEVGRAWVEAEEVGCSQACDQYSVYVISTVWVRGAGLGELVCMCVQRGRVRGGLAAGVYRSSGSEVGW